MATSFGIQQTLAVVDATLPQPLTAFVWGRVPAPPTLQPQQALPLGWLSPAQGAPVSPPPQVQLAIVPTPSSTALSGTQYSTLFNDVHALLHAN